MKSKKTNVRVYEPAQKTILEEAQLAVYGDRAADYGTVTDNFQRIADYWNVTLKSSLSKPITPAEVGLCMCGVKMARQAFKEKRDNLVDLAGYAATLEKLSKGE
jgi:hypothetical protein